jgi:hypothetical protein
MTAPIVTALVSTYASERFLAGCLDDLLAQTIGAALEIVVVDACSPEREGELVRAFQLRHPHARLRYVRTAVRESTSAAFNRATALATGRYLTTANTDDRHHPAFCERLAAVLDQTPRAGIAWADAAIGTVPNERWEDTTATQRFAWPAYTPATALSCCLFGPQPMWRRELHGAAGAWSERFPIANDHDMFLRLARAGGAVHVDEVLGLFLQRGDSNAGAGRAAAVLADACAVLREHRRAWTLDEIVPGATASGPLGTAAAWFELGNLAALGPYTDAALALDCWRRAVALALPPVERELVRAAFANNSGCVLTAAGALAPAARAFAAASPGDVRDHNLRRLAAARGGHAPALRSLRYCGIDHDVVRASRLTSSVTVDAAGRVRPGPVREQIPWDVFDGPNGVPWSRAEQSTGAVTRARRQGHVRFV